MFCCPLFVHSRGDALCSPCNGAYTVGRSFVYSRVDPCGQPGACGQPGGLRSTWGLAVNRERPVDTNKLITTQKSCAHPGHAHGLLLIMVNYTVVSHSYPEDPNGSHKNYTPWLLLRGCRCITTGAANCEKPQCPAPHLHCRADCA